MTGLLLLNLGTPDSPDTPAVRAYLREFLSDPRVLDIAAIGRWLLLHLFILPTRPAKSAAAYRKIWTDRGSPLLFHSEDLAARVREALGSAEYNNPRSGSMASANYRWRRASSESGPESGTWHVELALRYGRPSVAQALAQFRARGIDRLVLFPLYPQYSAASTGSSIEEVYRQVGKGWHVPSVSVVPPFYDHPDFIASFASIGRPLLDGFAPDHVLMSFHGLPERHMQKADASEDGRHCLASPTCCDAIVLANRNCYRAQCMATARGLGKALGLSAEQFSVSFQSRLGRTPWIGPYTDHVLVALARAGKKRVAVFCPAFVADCLETLEEIAIRGREMFLAAGGEELMLVPSLNSDPSWVRAVVRLATAAPQ